MNKSKIETNKYQYFFLFVSLIMLILGFLNSGNLIFEEYNSTLVFIYFFLSMVFIFLQLPVIKPDNLVLCKDAICSPKRTG